MTSGPAPKHPSARRRRNKVSTAATLRVLDPDDIVVPPLPPRRQWQPETLERWETVHSSPMAPEFTDSDLYNLYDLAELWDDFLLAESPADRIKISSEIRLKGKDFGLTPLDRRRLSWEIDRGEEAEEATKQRRERQRREALKSVDDDGEDAYAALS